MTFQVLQGNHPVAATELIVEFGQFQIAESTMSTDSVEVPAIDAERFILAVKEAGFTITSLN